MLGRSREGWPKAYAKACTAHRPCPGGTPPRGGLRRWGRRRRAHDKTEPSCDSGGARAHPEAYAYADPYAYAYADAYADRKPNARTHSDSGTAANP